FYNGDGKPLCERRQVGVVAFTAPRSRVVYICPGYALFYRHDPDEAEAGLIHEALHSLGLGENPPSSRYIQVRVRARCLAQARPQEDPPPSASIPDQAQSDVSLHPPGAPGSRPIEMQGIDNRSPRLPWLPGAISHRRSASGGSDAHGLTPRIPEVSAGTASAMSTSSVARLRSAVLE